MMNYTENRTSLPGKTSLKTIDLHTGGEPLRVIIEGLPEIQGNNILEKRAWFRNNLDHIRTGLMWEPRGHADMYGCVPVEPNDEGADFGLLFLHNEGYSTNCGHAIIAFSRLAVEMGWIEKTGAITEISIDAPCGRMRSYVHSKGDQITKVGFDSVPSFVSGLDLEVEIKRYGKITFDIAFGGAYYIYLHVEQLGLELIPEHFPTLIRLAAVLKEKISVRHPAIHPFEKDLSFIYGVIYIDRSDRFHSKNMCVFANGEVDRCPTGSGLSGRLAIHFERKELGIGDMIEVESVTGSSFTGMVKSELSYGSYQAVIPLIEGNAWITGTHDFFFDDEDPFANGFLVR